LNERPRSTWASIWQFTCTPKQLLLFTLGLLLLWVGYALLLRPLVIGLFQDRAPDWFGTLVKAVYPRLEVEKHRFSAVFFLDKSLQLMLRASMVVVGIFLSIYWFPLNKKLKKFWRGLLTSEADRKTLSIYRVIFYLSLLGFTKDWFFYLLDYSNAEAFYKPVFILSILGVPFPQPWVVKALFALYVVSIAMVISGKRAAPISVLVAFLFLLQLAWQQSFEKIQHTYATFGYAVLLMPFLLYQAGKVKGSTVPAWPIILLRLSIAGAYFFSGLEKLLISGIAWPSAETVRFYLDKMGGALSLPLATPLLALGSLLVLIWQLSFPLSVFLPKYKYYWLVGGCIFHASTVWALGVGAFINPWIAVYLFFWKPK